MIVGTNLTCLRQGLTSDYIGTGGNDNPLKIWDLEMGIVKFTAKRVSLNVFVNFSLLCFLSPILALGLEKKN